MDNPLHFQELYSNIKNKNVCKTSYGNSVYSDLWYADTKNKICVTFTPRGGCSISFQQYLDIVGLLDDGLKYDNFIHNYRVDIFNKCIEYRNIQELIDEKYIFIKFIMNPYIRAVSIYRAQISNNCTFREYLKKKLDGTLILNENDTIHDNLQYIDEEEKIITKYIKINENEIYQIKLFDETPYIIDVNKYTSIHHAIKQKHTNFCGDIPRIDVNENLPISYKYFYDSEIKQMVDTLYKNDIEKYGFNFLE